MRILLVEDDECIAKALEQVLGEQHYVVDLASDGQVGWELVEAFTYDLILLDVILPKLNGIEFCQKLRSRGDQTPVLLLTAQSSSTKKVMGLDAGADDYVVKPFEVLELLARIRVLLRRRNSLTAPVLEWANLRLDPSICEVTYSGQILHLTPKEYRLLELFLRSHHQVLTRSAILENLWAVEEAPNEDTVTAHIKSLRQKLRQAGAPANFIETVYGLGYRLKSSASSLSSPSRTNPQREESQLQQQTKAGLAVAWEKYKEQNRDRITILEQATTALRENTLELELQQKAQVTAHKLAGALGVFGFAEGSRLAKEIEQLLQSGVSLDQLQVHRLSKLVLSLRTLLDKAAAGQLAKSWVHHRCPVMVVVDNDAELAERIARQSVTLKIRLERVPNLSAARIALTQPSLDVVLLDFAFANAAEDHLTLLAELINQTPPVPVLLFTIHDNLTNRVKAAQLGVHAFFQEHQLPEQILETITRVLKQICRTVAKVMVVDDDPQVLAVMRSLLEPWGIKITTVDEPLVFWQALEEFSPDLLVLDLEMPHFSGIELCQAVRNDPRWCGLPILFFTVHTNASTAYQVLTAGADDYISKSIVEPELVTRIFNHLERVQLLRSMTPV